MPCLSLDAEWHCCCWVATHAFSRSPFSTLSQVVVLDGIILSTGLDSTSHVVCEIFDYDPIGSDDFLGRFTAVPLLRTKVYIALWILLLFLCFVCL